MKRLDRYVMTELVVPFLIGTVAVVLMFQANMLIYLFKTFSLSQVPFSGVAKLLLYKTPFYLTQTLPVGIALATSLAVSRLTRESELTALRAAGASILRVMVPIGFFGAVVGVGNYFLAENVMPAAEKEARQLNTTLMILGAVPDFKANVFIKLGNYSANFGSVTKADNGALQLNDVILIERPRPNEDSVFTAKTGTYENGLWSFKEGLMRYFKGDDLWQFKPKSMEINQRINLNDLFSVPQATEMTLSQLRKEIESAKEQRADATGLELQLFERFSGPASCCVFALVGPVFAIGFARGGGFVGVLLSILMVMLYYNVWVISTDIFGRNGWLTPMQAAWMPNVLFLVAALVGIRRLE